LESDYVQNKKLWKSEIKESVVGCFEIKDPRKGFTNYKLNVPFLMPFLAK